MPRLLGVDIPNDKKSVVSLTYLYGVGPKTARDLCHKAAVDQDKKARDLTDEELSRLAKILERDYTVEGPLRRHLQQSIQSTSRHQVLSRNASSAGVAGTRSTDENQCTHAKRPKENRGGQKKASRTCDNWLCYGETTFR